MTAARLHPTRTRDDVQDTSDALDRRAVVAVCVLVLGGLLVVLDTTVMNVAIGPLSRAMDTSLPVIQWVLTGYTLALASVIPTTAWAIDRFGAKRVYLSALTLFVSASLLAGLAWNIETLIAFRVVQGLGGGLLMPVAMSIALRLARPAQRGRIMALLGIPVLIGPVAGPILGGWLLDALSWRWIFFINLPLGLLAFVLAVRVLTPDSPNPTRRLDVPGLMMLSPGLAAFVYGIARSGGTGGLLDADVLGPTAVGTALVLGFVARAQRATHPLIDIRLLRRRAMAAGTVVLALFAAAYFGSMFLVPLYYQVVRGESATASGLLLVPQALATGITMQVAGRLIDRMPARTVIAAGITLATLGYFAFMIQVAAGTNYWVLIAALTIAGIGVGATLMPTMTAATRDLAHADVPSGTTLLNITNQVAISVGAAATAVLLSTNLTARLPGLIQSGVGDLYDLRPHALRSIAGQLAAGVGTTFILPVALMLAALTTALLFMPRSRPGIDTNQNYSRDSINPRKRSQP